MNNEGRKGIGFTILLWASFILILECWIQTWIWFSWYYPKNYNYALLLADDSSLPAVKADYLREYLQKVDTITGKPAYIFMRPDLELGKQKAILQGLITRFDDIAKLSPNEMAYQQGMYQLSGQEVDHQLERISSIFQGAKLRESIGLFLWFALFSWLSPCLLGIGLVYRYFFLYNY